MPAVSPTMEVGTLVAWKVAEGQPFASGTVVAEIGTDKANMDAEIFDEGVMIKHLLAEGDEAPPGQPIAIWGTKADEDVTALVEQWKSRKPTEAKKEKEKEPENGKELGKEEKQEDKAEEPQRPETRRAPVAIDLPPRLFMDPPGDLGFGGQVDGDTHGRMVRASPLARKVAKEKGIDLGRLKGTGPGGRIVKADLDRAPAGPVGRAAIAPREDAHVK